MGAGGAKGAKGAKGGCNRCAPIAPIAPTAPIAPNLPAWLSSSAAATATAAIAALEAAATTAAPTHRLGPRLVDHQGAPFHLEFVQLGDSLLSFLVAGHFNEPESTCPARGHVAHDARAFHGPRPAEELGKLCFAGLIRKVPHVQLATHNTDSSVPCGTHKKSRSAPDGPHRSFTSKRCVRVWRQRLGSAPSALRRYRRSGGRQFQYTPLTGFQVPGSGSTFEKPCCPKSLLSELDHRTENAEPERRTWNAEPGTWNRNLFGLVLRRQRLGPTEEEVLHLLRHQLLGFFLPGHQAVLVEDHLHAVFPHLPRLRRHVVVNALAEISRPRRFVEPR